MRFLIIMKNVTKQVVLAVLLAATGRAAESGSSAMLDAWFTAQAGLHTWSAEVVQTRAIKTFSHPLISTGRVWAVIPDQFRWEIGQPPQTIAIRQPTQLLLHYPKLKRLEKYPLDEKQTGPWRDALALLDASFPRSRAELEARFAILSVAQSNGVVQLTLQPRSAFARKFMSELQVGFRANDFVPAFTVLKFSDGSTMRNDFSNSVTNAVLSPTLFEETLPPGTSVVEPGKK